jgi:hypothetical protein
VRLVYCDEAGISNPAHEPFVTVAGVIVQADNKLRGVENHLASLIRRHVPSRHQDGFVFHAKELFNGGGKVFDRKKVDFNGPVEFPLERRLEIADDIAKIPKKFDLQIAFGIIERATFHENFPVPVNASSKQRAVLAQGLAFMNCSMFVEHWMREHATDEVCLLVVEDNDQARTFIREIHTYHQRKDIAFDKEATLHFPWRKIKEDPLFQPKRPTSPLSIADFFAYVWKRYVQGDKKYERWIVPAYDKVISFDDSTFSRWREKQRRIDRFSQRQAS